MFAVKEWAVDASSLKPQTEIFKAAPSTTDEAGQKESKKRKRGAHADPVSEDVGRLWDKHIEGKKEPRKDKSAKKQRETPKDNGSPAVATAQDASTAPWEAVNGKQGEHTAHNEDAERGNEKKKSKKKKKQKEEHHATSDKSRASGVATQGSAVPPPAPKVPAGPKLTPMQAAMRQKLISARFRHLNETLYTEPSVKALELFDQNPEMFEDYHSGFRQQVSVWPENPVDIFIATIRSRGSVRLTSQKNAFRGKNKKGNADAPAPSFDRSVPPLPRTHGTCIIADLGCGDARLAQTLKDSGDGTKLNIRVQSFDLHSPSPLVTRADISKLPVADGSVDVAIFCLALMGTNWISFIEEAYRILHWKGELWIAEIKSRFGRVGRAGRQVVEHSVGGKRKQAALKKAQEAKKREQEDVNEQEALQVEVDGVPVKNTETDVTGFVEILKRRGFILKDEEKSIDLSNRMFVRMEFVKAAAPTKGKGVPSEAANSTPKFKAKAKFLDDVEDIATDDESKALKPCLYKIR